MKNLIKCKNVFYSFLLSCLGVFLIGCSGSDYTVPFVPVTTSSTYLIDEIGRVLEEKAFAWGAGFENARQKLNPYRTRIDTSKGGWSVCVQINDILKKEFKVSHLGMFIDSGKGGEVAPMPWPEKITRSYNHNLEPKYYEQAVGNKRVGILKLPTFGDEYTAKRLQLAAFINQASSADALIIDLQENTGGFARNVKDLLGYFIASNTEIYQEIDRSNYRAYVNANGSAPTSLNGLLSFAVAQGDIFSWPGKYWTVGGSLFNFYSNSYNAPFNKKLYVLTNAHSASCSEIFANAVKNHCHAITVGTKSAGAVLPSLQEPISNFILQYPTSEIIDVNGRRLEGMGVMPTIVAQSNALQTALNNIISH